MSERASIPPGNQLLVSDYFVRRRRNTLLSNIISSILEMASQFPKLPGYVVTHDPTIVSHKKVSHVKLEQVRNAMNVDVPLYKVPQPPLNLAPEHKNDASRSYSHNQYPNHFGADI